MEDSIINNLFKSLKTFIDNQDYEHAVELLENNKKKFDPGVYHYNLASIYAKQELLVSARIHYELALNNGYVSPALRDNLGRVRQSLQVVDSETPEGVIDNFHYLFVVAPKELFLSCILLSILLLTIGLKKLGWKLKVLLIVVLLLPIGYGFYFYQNTSVVVLKEDKVVREGPSKIFEERQVMPRGMKVLVGRTYSKFIEVIYPKAYKGWIEKTGQYYLRK